VSGTAAPWTRLSGDVTNAQLGHATKSRPDALLDGERRLVTAFAVVGVVMTHDEHHPGADDEQVVRLIEDYLRAHPGAGDTVEGVAQWWLPGGVARSAEAVQRALGVLVARGVLVERRGRDGRCLYRQRALEE
jgi:hypothetical protein